MKRRTKKNIYFCKQNCLRLCKLVGIFTVTTNVPVTGSSVSGSSVFRSSVTGSSVSGSTVSASLLVGGGEVIVSLDGIIL